MNRTLIALLALSASFPAFADDPTGFDPSAACAPDDTECLERVRQEQNRDATRPASRDTTRPATPTTGDTDKSIDEMGAVEDQDGMYPRPETAFVPREEVYLENGRYVIVEEKLEDQLVLKVHEGDAVREAADGIEANISGKSSLEPYAAKLVNEAQLGIDDPEVLQALHMTLDGLRPGLMQGEDPSGVVPAGRERELDRTRTLEEGSKMPSTTPYPSAGGDPMPVPDTTGAPSLREEAGTITPGDASPEPATPVEDDVDPYAIEKSVDEEAEELRPTTIERDIDVDDDLDIPDEDLDTPIVPPPAPEIEQIEEMNSTDETFDDADDVGDQAPE